MPTQGVASADPMPERVKLGRLRVPLTMTAVQLQQLKVLIKLMADKQV